MPDHCCHGADHLGRRRRSNGLLSSRGRYIRCSDHPDGRILGPGWLRGATDSDASWSSNDSIGICRGTLVPDDLPGTDLWHGVWLVDRGAKRSGTGGDIPRGRRRCPGTGTVRLRIDRGDHRFRDRRWMVCWSPERCHHRKLDPWRSDRNQRPAGGRSQ